MTLLHTDFNPIRRLYWPGYQYLLLIMEASVANASANLFFVLDR